MTTPVVNTAQSLYLASVRVNGRIAGQLGTKPIELAIAGAALCDLVHAGRIDLDDPKHPYVVDATPVGETGVDAALAYLVSKPGSSLKKTLIKTSTHVSRGVQLSLAHDGITHLEDTTLFDRVAGRRVTIVNEEAIETLRAEITSGLSSPATASDLVRDIATLAVASDGQKTVLAGVKGSVYKPAVKEWMAAHHIARCVKKICRDYAAIIATGVAGGVSAS